MLDRDMIAHLEAQGFRVVPANKVLKLTTQHAEDLQVFHWCQGDIVRVIKSRMGMELGHELMKHAGWHVEDKEGLRLFRTEVEVIL